MTGNDSGGLHDGEWVAVFAGAGLLVSMLALDWFAYSVLGAVAAGSEGNAFRWLGATEVVLTATVGLAVAIPALRRLGAGFAAENGAVVVAGAAFASVILILIAIVSPPTPSREDMTVFGGGPDSGLVTRAGAVAGLVAAGGVLAGALLVIARPATTRPFARRRAARATAAGPAEAGAEPQAADITAAVAAVRTAAEELQAAATRPGAAAAPAPTAKRKAPAKRKPAAARSKTPAKPKAPARKRTVRPRVATVTAEKLIELGLTPAQARRVVRYRDELGAIRKVADIDQVPQISQARRAALREGLRD